MKEIIIHLIDKCFDNLEGCTMFMVLSGLILMGILLLVLGVLVK